VISLYFTRFDAAALILFTILFYASILINDSDFSHRLTHACLRRIHVPLIWLSRA